MVIGRLQTGLDMCCLSRGTLGALQNLNPWQRGVLLMVFFETVVPTLFRSSTRTCLCSSGLILHLPHDHWCPARWDLAWSSRPRATDRHPFSNNGAYYPVAHPSLVQVYNLIPDVLSGLGQYGEVSFIQGTGVQPGPLQTGNEWRTEGLLKETFMCSLLLDQVL